jgi:protein-S-isoprenylcysteine O-methyltransferase Ste14
MRTTAAALGSSVFFAVAPGVVAGVVPWALTGWQAGDAPGWLLPVRAAGAVLVAGCAVVLVQAFVRFVREGRGTPAPVAPTERLVVGGLYRHVRNPMYVAVVGAILGQAALLARPVLLAYAVVAGAGMAAFVRWHEEPVLAARYGEQYAAYRRAVPGWVPRLRPWRADEALT